MVVLAQLLTICFAYGKGKNRPPLTDQLTQHWQDKLVVQVTMCADHGSDRLTIGYVPRKHEM
jgi:hypothetical protein